MPRLTAFFATLFLAACTTTSMDHASAAAEFVVVRHAEKADGAGPDPSLTPEGQARARSLAESLAGAPVVAVYSTTFARTRETALPTAEAHGLAVTTYDAREPADALATHLRATHATGTVLVVGHSNTVPAIASALCGCDVAVMAETEYDRRVVVTVDAAGATTLAVDRLPGPTGE